MAVHERQLAEHGGLDGVRDPGAVDSALARPRNSGWEGRAMNISISLTPELVGLIEAKVESGRYTSTSEVVREALRLLERTDAREADALARLRQAWDQGVASGDAGELDFAQPVDTANRSGGPLVPQVQRQRLIFRLDVVLQPFGAELEQGVGRTGPSALDFPLKVGEA